MPRGLNKVIIIGNLGRDPEMRRTPAGQPVTTFSVACSRRYTSADGERHEIAEWFHVVAWRRLAEICAQHLVRGSRVYVEGRLQTRTWEDGEGRRQQRVEIVAQEMIVLEAGPREVGGHAPDAQRHPIDDEPYEIEEHEDRIDHDEP